MGDSLSHNSEDSHAVQISAQQLREYFLNFRGAIVAYSGGVDSGLLAYAAHLALGARVMAVLADSPSLSRREYQSALDFGRKHGIPLRVIQTREMENPKTMQLQPPRQCLCFPKSSDLAQGTENCLPSFVKYMRIDHRP